MKILLSLLLLRVVVAFGYLATPFKTCAPTHHYITATRTTIAVDHEYLTVFLTEESHEDLPVTVPYVTRPLQYETVQVTVVPEPLTLVETDYLTDLAYQTSVFTVFATAVVIDTLHVYVTEVAVEDRTITQTKIEEHVVTDTLTRVSVKTLLRTQVLTETEFVFVTKTTLVPHVVTVTSHKVVGTVQSEEVVTKLQEQEVGATVTVTENQTVTSCYAPMITYNH